jgi:hypothetical protein
VVSVSIAAATTILPSAFAPAVHVGVAKPAAAVVTFALPMVVCTGAVESNSPVGTLITTAVHCSVAEGVTVNVPAPVVAEPTK